MTTPNPSSVQASVSVFDFDADRIECDVLSQPERDGEDFISLTVFSAGSDPIQTRLDVESARTLANWLLAAIVRIDQPRRAG